MKKYLILLLVPILLLAGCGKKQEKKEIIEISFDEYNTKLKNEESFVLYIGSATCSHCAAFRPKLEEIVDKYQLDVYYIDISKITEDEYAKIKNKVFLTGTPTLTYFESGKYSTEKVVGDKDSDEVIKFFKTIKMIGD